MKIAGGGGSMKEREGERKEEMERKRKNIRSGQKAIATFTMEGDKMINHIQ